MNKKEEKLFDEKFCMEDYDISFSDIKDIKNWITEHDKRERERLIDKIIEDIYSYDGNLISRTAIEIINKYK